MGGSVDRFGWILLDGAVATTAVVGLAALLMIATGQPARRIVLARLALLAALAVVPLARAEIPPRFHLSAPLMDMVDLFRHGAIRPGPHPVWHSARAILRPVVILSTTGTAMGLAWLFLGWWGCARLVRGTIEPSDETGAIYESLAFSGIGLRPRLRVAARADRPVLLGLLRPVILIPTDLDQPGREEPLRLGLLHELAHAGRLDPLFTLCGSLAQAAWFFVPPLWWVRRQMRLDQEFLADRVASGLYGPPVEYAQSLVKLAMPVRDDGEFATGPPAPLRFSTSALIQRVMMLVKCPFPIEDHAPAGWVALQVVLLGLATILASGLTLQVRGKPSAPACSGDQAGHGQIHFQKMSIEAADVSRDGLPRRFALLDRMPEGFVLEAEIWADPTDFSRIAIAGRWLGPALEPARNQPAVEGYHKLRVVRDRSGIALWVNDRPVPPDLRDVPPPNFLSVEPAPGRAIRLRDVQIDW